MKHLHFSHAITTLYLVDDFGTELQVIPGEHCRSPLAEQVLINHDSWTALACAPTFHDLHAEGV